MIHGALQHFIRLLATVCEFAGVRKNIPQRVPVLGYAVSVILDDLLESLELGGSHFLFGALRRVGVCLSRMKKAARVFFHPFSSATVWIRASRSSVMGMVICFCGFVMWTRRAWKVNYNK
jgi:hypothetical protein